MADVFMVLAKDHEEVKGMLAELEKGPTWAAGASQDQLARRTKMTEQLTVAPGCCQAGLAGRHRARRAHHRPFGKRLKMIRDGQ